MRPITRKIRIQIPSVDPGGIADVVDAETGESLLCRSFSLEAHAERRVSLVLELIEAEAQVVGVWLCKKIREEPLG